MLIGCNVSVTQQKKANVKISSDHLLIICTLNLNLIISFIGCLCSCSTWCSWIFRHSGTLIKEWTWKQIIVSAYMQNWQSLNYCLVKSVNSPYWQHRGITQEASLQQQKSLLLLFYGSWSYMVSNSFQELSDVDLHFNNRTDTVPSGILNVVSVHWKGTK